MLLCQGLWPCLPDGSSHPSVFPFFGSLHVCVCSHVSHVMQVVEGIEGAALAAAVDALLITQQNAERAGIAGPPQGWPSWLAALTQAGEGRLEPPSATDTSGQL